MSNYIGLYRSSSNALSSIEIETNMYMDVAHCIAHQSRKSSGFDAHS